MSARRRFSFKITMGMTDPGDGWEGFDYWKQISGSRNGSLRDPRYSVDGIRTLFKFFNGAFWFPLPPLHKLVTYPLPLFSWSVICCFRWVLAGANGSFSFKITMGMTDPEALEAPRSRQHQPTQPNLPEAPESIAEYQQRGNINRASWRVNGGAACGIERYQPGPKEKLATGNQQPYCGQNMFGESSRLLLCTSEQVPRPHAEIKIAVRTISRWQQHLEWHRSQNAAQFKVPRKAFGPCPDYGSDE